MRILLDTLYILITIGGVCVVPWYFVFHKKRVSAPDKCKHKHWSKWTIEKTQEVHLYGEPDEGKELPDRIDVYLIRECLDCGLPQARTDRGIDSRQYK